MLIGEYVRFKRAELGLTQEQLAENSGVNRSYLSRLEKGHFKQPSLSVITKLSHAFGVYVEELIRIVDIDAKIIKTEELPPFEDYLRLKYDIPRGHTAFNDLARSLFRIFFAMNRYFPPSETTYEQMMKLDLLSTLIDEQLQRCPRKQRASWQKLEDRVHAIYRKLTDIPFDQIDDKINSILRDFKVLRGDILPEQQEAETKALKERAEKFRKGIR